MEYTQLYGFSGVNRFTAPLLLDKGELHDVQNYEIDKIGVLRKSFNYSLINAQIEASASVSPSPSVSASPSASVSPSSSTSPSASGSVAYTAEEVLNGIDFHRLSGQHEHFVIVNGEAAAHIFKDVAGTWVDQNITLSPNFRYSWATSRILDKLYLVRPNADALVYDGSSWTTDSDIPLGQFIYVWNNRIRVFNVANYPMRMRFSTRIGGGAITWNDDAAFDFPGIITGVGEQGENLFLGTDTGVYILPPSEAETYKISTQPCVSHMGIANYGKWAFWASYDGMYATQGGEDQKISMPYEDFWRAIPAENFQLIQAKVRNHHLYVYIGDVTVDGENYNNVLFDYNILANSWMRSSLTDHCTSLHLFPATGVQELMVGSTAGKVFQLFEGDGQNATAYTSMIETDWDYGSGPKNIDDWREVWIHGQKLGGLQVSYKVDSDDNPWKPVTKSFVGDSFRGNMSAVGQRIKYAIMESSLGHQQEIHAIESGWQPRYMKQT